MNRLFIIMLLALFVSGCGMTNRDRERIAEEVIAKQKEEEQRKANAEYTASLHKQFEPEQFNEHGFLLSVEPHKDGGSVLRYSNGQVFHRTPTGGMIQLEPLMLDPMAIE